MKTTPYILFRVDEDNEEEYEAAKRVWRHRVTRFRSEIPPNSRVIGRYSVLPFYKDLADELAIHDSALVNSYAQHRFIANMDWVPVLGDLTFKTWFDVGHATAPLTEHGWVVKGRTNSRKFKWRTHMYAPDRIALKFVMENLYDDELIRDQGLVVREYVPLMEVGQGINGLPLTNEYRVFMLDGLPVSSGFYWSIAEDADDHQGTPSGALTCAVEAQRRLGDQAPPFYVVDVAQTQAGDWKVVELNDGQMSGLSMIDPEKFYRKLAKKLKR